MRVKGNKSMRIPTNCVRLQFLKSYFTFGEVVVERPPGSLCINYQVPQSFWSSQSCLSFLTGRCPCLEFPWFPNMSKWQNNRKNSFEFKLGLLFLPCFLCNFLVVFDFLIWSLFQATKCDDTFMNRGTWLLIVLHAKNVGHHQRVSNWCSNLPFQVWW